jgi:hypothetical protein
MGISQLIIKKIYNTCTSQNTELLTASITYLNTTIANVLCALNTPTGSKSVLNLTACTLQVTCFGFDLHTLCLTTSFKQKLIFNYVLGTTVYSANCTHNYVVFWNSRISKCKARGWQTHSKPQYTSKIWNIALWTKIQQELVYTICCHGAKKKGERNCAALKREL